MARSPWDAGNGDVMNNTLGILRASDYKQQTSDTSNFLEKKGEIFHDIHQSWPSKLNQ